MASGSIHVALARVRELAKPWEFSRYYRKTDWTIEELVCEDNATYEEFETQLLEFGDE